MNEIRITVTIVGTALSQWLGGFDGLLEALILFMIVDYITGVFHAVTTHTLSSAIGAKGILQKVFILMLVGMANILDTHIIEGDVQILRTAVIFFYLSNEGISILENATKLGLPVPDKLKIILANIKDKS